MEGLVSEVSIITEAGEDSAPSWPLAQLQHVSLALLGSRTFPRFVSALVCLDAACRVSVSLCAFVRAGKMSSCGAPGCLNVLSSFSNGWVRRASLAAT